MDRQALRPDRGMARRQGRLWHRLLLMVLCLAAFVPGIASLPPTDRDEARYVQSTRQMVETGDYIDIRLQEENRYKKPIGIYWLQAAAVNLSGQGADAPVWIYRTVSVAGAVSAVLIIFFFGAHLFGPAAGLLAALGTAAMFGLGFEARIAKVDAMLLAVTLAAQATLGAIYLARKRGKMPAGWLAYAFWAAQGAGLLLKGPITPLVCALTIVPILVLDRDRAWLKSLRPLRGLPLALLIALPWPALITWKSGIAFWQEAVVDDMFGKVAEGQESHGFPPGYYFLTYSLFMWPFAVLALEGGLKALNWFRQDPRLLFLLSWYIPLWLFFELVPTKLPHYVLPGYPALMLLMGWLLTSREAASIVLRGWQVWLLRAAAAGAVLVTVGLAAIAAAAVPYVTGDFSAAGLIAGLAVLAAGWLALSRRPEQAALPKVAGATVAAVLSFALMTTSVIPALSPIWLSPRIAEAFETAKPCPDSVLISAGYHEPSLVFLTGTQTRLVGGEGAARELMGDDACAVAAITTGDEMESFASTLPGGLKMVEEIGRVDGINYSKGEELEIRLFRAAED